MAKRKFKFIFDKRINKGYYSAEYFKKSAAIVKKHAFDNSSIMQFSFFNKKTITVCGIEESFQMLKAAIPSSDFKKIKFYAQKDGDRLKPKTPAIIIQGPYELFAIYENIIDSILARRSSVATNCYEVCKLVNSKKVIFMGDRSDDYLLQKYDGYSAYVGGIKNFVTEASTELFKNAKDIAILGTIPHALIQQFSGDLIKTLNAYNDVYKKEKLVGLIDYHNDIEKEIKIISKLDSELFAVRVDTSSNLIDKGLQRKYGNNKDLRGINPKLVELCRKTLDNNGLEKTKIIVSSSLDLNKITTLEKKKAPIDFYGIGSSLIQINLHCTADLVMLNNKHEAKHGRYLFIAQKNIKKLNYYK